jgi:polyhydroxyalkanoate synthesis regulator phasin
MELWDAIGRFEDSQTQVLTTLLLLVGGGLGVWLGSMLFGGRVADLKSAIQETEEAVSEFKSSTMSQLEALQRQLDATMEQLTRARKEITDLAPQEPEAAMIEPPIVPGAPQGDRAEFLRLWYAVRQRLRTLSQRAEIHGHRRNRYAKYNNNQIGVLIDDMRTDGELSEDVTSAFHDAHDLFAWHRNGRPNLTPNDVHQMGLFAARVGA